jgi:hypothetical protein
LSGAPVDLAAVREVVEALPDGIDRRDIGSSIAVAESLARHRSGDASWLDPLLGAWRWVPRRRIPFRQLVRVWLARVGILLSFVLPAVAIASSGVGAPEPYPAAYSSTTFQVRGDVGRLDAHQVARALPSLAADVAGHAPVRSVPLADSEWDRVISDGLPTLIWEVDATDLAAPSGITCDKVHTVEVLLGASRPTAGGAIVTCGPGTERRFLVPVGDATIRGIRTAVGLAPAP